MRASASAGAPANSRSASSGRRRISTYTYDYLGAGPETLADITRHSFADILRKAERPMVIVGAGAFARGDGAAVASLAAKAAVDLGAVKDGWNGYCVLHNAASRVGALDLGFVPGQGALSARQMAAFGTLDLLFLLGVDEIDVAPGAFVVYIGTHGDRGAHARRRGAAGRRLSGKIGDLRQHRRPRADGDARLVPARRRREDWAILRALSDVLKNKLPYDSLVGAAAGAVQGPSASDARSVRSRRATPPTSKSSQASAAPSTRRRSRRASTISTSPIRSRAVRR